VPAAETALQLVLVLKAPTGMLSFQNLAAASVSDAGANAAKINTRIANCFVCMEFLKG
jgi:hypothetical protein